MKKAIPVIAAAVVLAALFPAAGARAATTYKIKAGTGFGKTFPGGSFRFYPDEVTLHPGDTLNFNFPVSILPVGTSPEQFLADNARLGDPYHVLSADPDEGATATKLNPAFAVFLDCGAADNPCVYDGKKDPLNPGFFGEGKFNVVIDAKPGDVLYALQVPWSTQALTINVVDANGTASTQEELDATAKQLKEQDKAAALALYDEYSKKHTYTMVDGKKVWDAWAGIDQGPIAILAMFPAKMKIKKGESVQFHFDLENEIHSATMPIKKAKKELFKMFAIACDPDGDDDLGPDKKPETEAPPFCNDPSQLEVDMGNVFQKGDGVVDKPSEYQDSGFRGPEVAEDGFFTNDPFTVQFNTKTEDDPIKWICSFHGPFMKGEIVVK